jgi:hypothetical protein
VGKYQPNGGAAVKHFLRRVAPPTARNSHHFAARVPAGRASRAGQIILYSQQKRSERVIRRARFAGSIKEYSSDFQGTRSGQLFYEPGTALFMKKIIHLNAFSQCAAALQSFGQFRNPRDRTSQEYTSTRFWVELARELEAGCFDSLFFADIHGV